MYLAPAALTCAAIVCLSACNAIRYLYWTLPAWVIPTCLLGHHLEQLPATGKRTNTFPLWLTAALLYCLIVPPDYLYAKQQDTDRALQPLAQCPVIAIGDGSAFAITPFLVQWRHFDDVFITNSPESEAISIYLQSKDSCAPWVIFADAEQAERLAQHLLPFQTYSINSLPLLQQYQCHILTIAGKP